MFQKILIFKEIIEKMQSKKHIENQKKITTNSEQSKD